MKGSYHRENSQISVTSISRRKFLACSLYSAGLAVPGAVGAVGILSNNMGADANVLSNRFRVGYWQGSEAIPDFDGVVHTAGALLLDRQGKPLDPDMCTNPGIYEVSDATDMQRGDQDLIGKSVKVTIHGLFAAEERMMQSLPGCSIGIRFPSIPETAFRAWSYQPASNRDGSAGTSFEVPIEDASGLNLELIVDDSATDGDSVSAFDVNLSPSGQTGAAKLQRGIYFIAWRGSRDAPLSDWRQYQVVEASLDVADAQYPDELSDRLRSTRLVRRFSGLAQSDMSYVVISIDGTTDKSADSV